MGLYFLSTIQSRLPNGSMVKLSAKIVPIQRKERIKNVYVQCKGEMIVFSRITISAFVYIAGSFLWVPRAVQTLRGKNSGSTEMIGVIV